MMTIGLFGLVIGSFLNAVIHRLPRKIPIRTGRSRCTDCGMQLRWYHNIPLVSYIALRGRCGFCGQRISLRYPVVESTNAVLYLFFFWQFGLSFNLLVFAFLTSALLVIFFIDLDFQIIPDAITIPGMILGLAVSLLPTGIGIVQSLIGLVAGGGSLYLLAIMGDWLFKKESMGGGDIKMAAMLGAFLGWQKVLLVFMTAAGVGVVISLLLMLVSSRLRQERVVPFGPFLSVATMVTIIYGDQII
ncbi:MAG: prepilin peptidase, partial [Candidatus Zixiibacteriota bacterium]